MFYKYRYTMSKHLDIMFYCRFLQSEQPFVEATTCTRVSPEVPTHCAPDVPGVKMLATAYTRDVFNRLDEMEAKSTSIFGQVLKIDSTKKVKNSHLYLFSVPTDYLFSTAFDLASIIPIMLDIIFRLAGAPLRDYKLFLKNDL